MIALVCAYIARQQCPGAVRRSERAHGPVIAGVYVGYDGAEVAADIDAGGIAACVGYDVATEGVKEIEPVLAERPAAKHRYACLGLDAFEEFTTPVAPSSGT